MKKLLLVLLMAVVLLWAATPAYAQARFGLQPSDAVETSTSLVLGPGTWMYKAVLFADAASSFAGIADAAAFQDLSSTTVVDEIGEATQFDDTVHTYDPPIYLTNGASVVMSVGTLILFSGPHP